MKNLLYITFLLIAFISCKKDDDAKPTTADIYYAVSVSPKPVEYDQHTLKISYKDADGMTKTETFTGVEAWNNVIIIEDFKIGEKAELKVESDFYDQGYEIDAKILQAGTETVEIASKLDSKTIEFTLSGIVK